MNTQAVLPAVAAGLILIVLVIAASYVQRKRPKSLKPAQYQRRWRELQKLCADKATWPLAIINADKLLDEALRKSHVRGKTMGERLVTAQNVLTDNDGVWYAHKLRNRLVHENYGILKERDVKDALVGIRQALKDLGAL